MQQSTGTKRQKTYKAPALKKLTPEQAKKFLVDHADNGDQGAEETLKLVLPTGNDSK